MYFRVLQGRVPWFLRAFQCDLLGVVNLFFDYHCLRSLHRQLCRLRLLDPFVFLCCFRNCFFDYCRFFGITARSEAFSATAESATFVLRLPFLLSPVFWITAGCATVVFVAALSVLSRFVVGCFVSLSD